MFLVTAIVILKYCAFETFSRKYHLEVLSLSLGLRGVRMTLDFLWKDRRYQKEHFRGGINSYSRHFYRHGAKYLGWPV